MLQKTLKRDYMAACRVLENEKNYPAGSTSTVGWGYNMWGRYASAYSIMKNAPLINWENVPSKYDPEFGNIPEIINIQKLEESDFRLISGESILSMQENLSVQSKIDGKYNFFSGSLSAGYSEQATMDSSNAFSYALQKICLYRIVLDVEKVSSYLNENLLSDFENMAPNEIFQKYGSHLLNDVIIGGKATMTSSINKSKFSSEYSIDISAKVTYESLTAQLSAEEQTHYEKTISSFRSSSQLEISTLGGDPILGEDIQKGSFKEWAATIKDNPVLIDFDVEAESPYIPIWELCPDKVKADALKDAFPAYAKAQKIKYQIYPSSVTDVKVVTGDTSEIGFPGSFTKVGYDLNATVGGKFIYVGYELKPQSDIIKGKLKVVTDLAIIFGQNTPPPPGFEKLPQDLNEGAGGEFVYLCVKKENIQDVDIEQTIKALDVIGATYSEIYPKGKWVRVNGDCNAGSGGNFIYVCYTKDV